jgi:molecular chaperone DnaJ
MVDEHPLFKREGQDVVLDVPVSFVQAALGAEIEVPTLKGTEKLKVPAGTQPGQVFKLKGKGIPHLRGSGIGDQLCRVTIEVPGKLSSRQKELLREFESLSADGSTPLMKGFFDKVKDLFGEKPKK